MEPFYFGRFYFPHFKTKWTTINNYRSTSEARPKPFGHPSLKVMQTKWSSINNYRSTSEGRPKLFGHPSLKVMWTKLSSINNYRGTSEGQPKPFGHPSLIVMQEWTHSLWELTSSFIDLSTLEKINKSGDIVNNFSFLFEPTHDNERLTYAPNVKFPLLKEDDVFSDVIKIR